MAGLAVGTHGLEVTAPGAIGGAPLASPHFTGTPTAPTATGTTTTTQLATTAFVHALPLTGDITGTPDGTTLSAFGPLGKFIRAPSGGDDGAVVQAAINAGFSKILLGPTTSSAPFTFTTVPTIPNGVNITFEGHGVKATYIKATGTNARFLDPNKTADYQTFGYTARGFTFDANNLSHSDAVFGSYNNGTTTLRINWSNVLCEDIDIINLPAPNTATNPAGFYFLNGQQNTDGTTATLTDIRIKRCRVFGGKLGFVVGAPGTPNASFVTFIDRVFFEDCYHDTLTTPSASPSGSWANFQIGVNGVGGFDIGIRNCIGKNSNDVGVETDGLNRVVCENVDIYNAWNDHFLHTPFQQVADVYAMETIYRNCRGITQSGSAIPGAGAFHTSASGSNTSGHLLYDNCWSIIESGATIPAGSTIWNFSIGANATQFPCLSVTYRDCHIDNGGSSGLTWSSASGINWYAWSLSPGQVGGFNTRVAFEGQNIVHHNVTQGSTGAIVYRGLCLNSSNGTTFNCEGGSVVYDYNSPSQTAGDTQLMIVGLNASSAKGVLPRMVVNSFAGGDTTPKGINIPATATLTIQSEIVVPSGCDFSGLPTTGTEIFRASNQGSAVRYGRAIRWSGAGNPLKSSAMSGSTFATATFTTNTWNQYTAPYDGVIQFVQASGAGITAIDISPDNGTTVINVLTQASGAMPAGADLLVPVVPGWYVRVVFATTQPTTNVLPQV